MQAFPSYVRPRPVLAAAMFGFLIACMMAAFFYMLWELRHPRLVVRKIPKPETVLNLGLKSSENIKNLS